MNNASLLHRPTRRGSGQRTLLAILAAILLVAGGIIIFDNTRATAETSNTITYLDQANWTTLYPPNAGYYPNGGIVGNITDRLLYQDPETLELYPWIATDLPEINADATEYTFHLRPGVTYSDGSPLDAANVAKNFDLYGLGDKSRKLSVSSQISGYSHSEVIDPLTVKFYFHSPAPGFLQSTSAINSGLYSNATLDRSLDEFGPGNALAISGSGPYVITGETIRKQTVLTAREDYNWAPPVLAKQGKADIAQITVIATPESAVRVGAIVAGQADIIRTVDAPMEQHLLAKGIDIVSASTRGTNNGFHLRFRHPLLADIRVRQAITLGINRDEILTTLFSPSYHRADGAVAHNAPGFVDLRAQHPEWFAYDPDRANQLLDQAGWRRGEDGIRVKDGQRLSLQVSYATVMPRSRDVITKAKEHLSRIGVEINPYSGDNTAQTVASSDITKIQISHSVFGRAELDAMKSQFSADNVNKILNGLPDGTVGDQQLEDLLQQIASSAQTADRMAASAAAQQRLLAEAYFIPLFEEPQVYAVAPKISGFTTEPVGRPNFYLLHKQEG
ncbi:TIGR04028 family ABC transporter substrate-binding protein [Corynebacterium choanae]|nr:TIGR04028 family ABC transporter substrate-binding protein [Corynebacterium choanae]